MVRPGCAFLCSGQFLTWKRDRDTWHARGYNERTNTTRPSTMCLCHPTSEQVPMSSCSTLTRRPRRHLRSSAQELRFNPDSATPTSPLGSPTSLISRRHQKLLGDSSSTGQRRDPRDYQIRSKLHGLNRSYLQPTDQVVAGDESSSYNQQIELRLRPTAQIKQLSRVFLSCMNISSFPTGEMLDHKNPSALVITWPLISACNSFGLKQNSLSRSFPLLGFHVNLCVFTVIIVLHILYIFGAREKVLGDFFHRIWCFH